MTIGRAVLAAVAALMLGAAAEPPPPPPGIAAYMEDGRFEAGDYGWTRSAFADATPEQQETFRAAMDWAAQCRRIEREEAARELAELGVDNPTLEDGYFGHQKCGAVVLPFDTARPFAEFEAALRGVRPIADTYIAAARLAQSRALGNAASYAETLTARTMEEQMLRVAMTWGREPLTGVPELSPEAGALLRGLLGAAMVRSDQGNSAWLKAQLAEKGWPKISEVGAKGASAAWLLTQHADTDPVFQLRALLMMEPLVAQEEVSKRDYAYLYDRIMLKLTGKQRYGTQWGACEGTVRQLRPLEDEAKLAELRAEMGMEPIEEYARLMDEAAGPCGG